MYTSSHILKRRVSVLVVALLLVMITAAGGHGTARAQTTGALTLSTDFTGITVSPGDSINLALTVGNQQTDGRSVDVEVTDVPEGWNTQLRGGGYTIHSVFVAGESTSQIDLETDIPASVEAGTYQMVVTATAGGDEAQLPIELQVSEAATGGAVMEAQYPSLRGTATAEFTYQLDLSNNYPEAQTFAFDVQAPEGWQTQLVPQFADREVTTLTVEGNSSESLEVTATPPEGVSAGEHEITVTASGQRSDATVDLTADVTGSYAMSITTESGRLNASATAGQDSHLQFLVENTGSSEITGASLNASSPSGWSVTFDPATIDQIAPGESRQVTATITPASETIAGDYEVTLRGSSDNASASQTFRITVRTSTAWGWIGALLILLVAGGVLYAFRIYGRR